MATRIRRTDKNVAVTRDYLGIKQGSKVIVTQIPVFNRQDSVFWGELQIGQEVDDVVVGETYTVADVYSDGSVLLAEPCAIFPWFCLKLEPLATFHPKYNTNANTPFYSGREVWINDKPCVITGSIFMDNTIMVTVTNADGVRFTVDYSTVRLYPKVTKTKVELNDSYTAVYTHGDEYVTVGCQSIPAERVLELADVIRKAKSP